MASWQRPIFRLIFRLYKFFLMRVPIHNERVVMLMQGLFNRDAARSSASGMPSGLSVAGTSINGVDAAWLRPESASRDGVILYLHGGGFVSGWNAVYRSICGQLAVMSGLPVLGVDYRLAPQHRFPAALDDCVAAYRGLLDTGYAPGQIALVGDSAGGNLVLTTTMQLRNLGLPLPAAVVALSPVTDMLLTGDSMVTNYDVILSPSYLWNVLRHYSGPDTDLRDPLLSPLYGDYAGFPTLLIHVARDEILFSDGFRVAQAAEAAGVPVRLHIADGLWHVWHLLAPYLPEARASLQQVADFVREQIAAAAVHSG